LLDMSLSPCCPYTPPECPVASVSPRHAMLPSPRSRGLGLRIFILFRGHLWVYFRYGPGNSLTILTMALSVGFIRFVILRGYNPS
jgi:hypothetical protein